jgi:hypothetical protein
VSIGYIHASPRGLSGVYVSLWYKVIYIHSQRIAAALRALIYHKGCAIFMPSLASLVLSFRSHCVYIYSLTSFGIKEARTCQASLVTYLALSIYISHMMGTRRAPSMGTCLYIRHTIPSPYGYITYHTSECTWYIKYYVLEIAIYIPNLYCKACALGYHPISIPV